VASISPTISLTCLNNNNGNMQMHGGLNKNFPGGVVRFEWGPPSGASSNSIDEKLERLARQLMAVEAEQTPEQVLTFVWTFCEVRTQRVSPWARARVVCCAQNIWQHHGRAARHDALTAVQPALR
jgi:hypothetical protein